MLIELFQATTEDGLPIYEFTLPLPEPIAPAAISFAHGVYDTEHDVEALLDQHGPVRFSGMNFGACIYDIHADPRERDRLRHDQPAGDHPAGRRELMARLLLALASVAGLLAWPVPLPPQVASAFTGERAPAAAAGRAL